MNVGNKLLILLLADNNKLLMHWKGPYQITNVCDLNDVNGNLKVYHINLLKEYMEQEPEEKGVLMKVSVAVIEDEKVEFEDETVDHTLELPLLKATKSQENAFTTLKKGLSSDTVSYNRLSPC